jgi:hypothetical protein
VKKALLALLAAALLLGGVVAFMKWREAVAERPRYAFAGSAGFADAVELRIRYLGDGVTLVRKGTAWVVMEDDFPADSLRLQRVFDALSGLQTGEIVDDSADASALAEYGLSPA